jgi:glyceraldehyde 3-phosphate dehydrogenase
MAHMKIGINGFGRIGRVFFRQAYQKLDIVGINTLDNLDGLVHLLKYDSSHGTFSADVSHDGTNLIVDGKKIMISQTKDPEQIPWKAWGAELVMECTGALKGKSDYQKHITAGAKKVMISAPADGVDITVVYGINHTQYDSSKHTFLSNASCTTNCLAPLAKVLNDNFKITSGTMMTIHSYTNDQKILDSAHKDLRRARTAGVSMIPTTTGAAKAVGLVLPELKGKIDGLSVRVPTPNVSLVDFTFNSEKVMTAATINEALKKAASNELKGVLAVEENELVSIDYNGNVHSSIVDAKTTMVIGDKMAKVLSWYDNEVGFSSRMVDMAIYMSQV